jgi:hypothetical protein
VRYHSNWLGVFGDQFMAPVGTFGFTNGQAADSPVLALEPVPEEVLPPLLGRDWADLVHALAIEPDGDVPALEHLVNLTKRALPSGELLAANFWMKAAFDPVTFFDGH